MTVQEFITTLLSFDPDLEVLFDWVGTDELTFEVTDDGKLNIY